MSKNVRRAYTLIELLVATTLTLMMMAAVATIFGVVGQSVNDSRATLEMADALRSTALRLQADLEGVTAATVPPRDPAANEGYFEYIEGPVGPVIAVPSTDFAVDSDNTSANNADTTPIDNDDILMFTTRSQKQPFVGRYNNPPATTIESQVAEVAWFVRGRTLYRRVLLVVPPTTAFTNNISAGFYANNDVSVHVQNPTAAPGSWTVVPNTLGDLTRRENRFAHQSPSQSDNYSHFPFHPHVYFNSSGTEDVAGWAKLGLPTLRECSKDSTTNPTTTVWSAAAPLPVVSVRQPAGTYFDAWTNPYPWDDNAGQAVVDSISGTLLNYQNGLRIAEDVILNNVIGFDVKAWDPGAPVLRLASGVIVAPGDPDYQYAVRRYMANGPGPPPVIVSYGAYGDLNYMCLLGVGVGVNPDYPASGEPVPSFHHAGNALSELRGTRPWAVNFTDPTTWPEPADALPSTYDTWSTHYESDGIQQNPNRVTDGGTNGFDDPVPYPGGATNGVVDDEDEQETSAPYPVPLRGIQVKIRVFDPDSRQVREVTIVQDFLKR